MEFLHSDKARRELERIAWRGGVLASNGVEFLVAFARTREQDVGPKLQQQFREWKAKRDPAGS